MNNPEHDELPGRPRKKLVREVRQHLWRYLRCRPSRTDDAWTMAWEWAHECSKRVMQDRWPCAMEIASQYLLVALARMRSLSALKLPFQANERMPASVQSQLALANSSNAGGPLLIA